VDFLRFDAAGGPLLAPLGDLDEVLMPARLEALPGGPPFLCGLLNLRGEAVAVLSLAERLGQGPWDGVWRPGGRILRCACRGRPLGLVVDGVSGIVTLATWDRRESARPGSGPAFLGALWMVGGHLVQELCVDALLDDTELARLPGAPAAGTPGPSPRLPG
jgi:purine-binding chemotaxis protein CheW